MKLLENLKKPPHLMEGTNIKLHYFDFYGRGELIRMILQYNNVPFDDVRYDPRTTFPEAIKAGKFPQGQVPVLEYGDKVMVQSTAIARFFCQKYNQYPTDPLEVYQVECVRDTVSDIYQKFFAYFMESDPVKSKEIHEKLLTETLAEWIPYVTKLLKENTTGSGYFVGKGLTLADFVVAEYCSTFLLHPDRLPFTQKTLDANPELTKYLKDIMATEFKEYFEKRKPGSY